MTSPEPRWSLATLIAFRFICAYAVLQWIPMSLSLLTTPLSLGTAGRINWWGRPSEAVGQWVITNLLTLSEHSPPRMSGNSLPLVLGIVSAMVVSAIVAAVWSALDRRRTSYQRQFVWMHTALRFLLAAIMLWYGWAKILPAQFAIGFDYIVLPVADHNPRDLLWAFMGASREYQIFSGVVEVAGGLLLMTRRTALIGAVISAAAMGNVVALDISYDVPVKFLAVQIFLMTLFVLAPFAMRLLDAMVLNRPVGPAPARPMFVNPAADSRARFIGVIAAAWIALATFQTTRNVVAELAANRQTPLYGIWDVEEMRVGGVAVPLVWPDLKSWRRVVVQSKNAAVIFPMSDSAPHQLSADVSTAVRYSARLDSEKSTIELTPFATYGTAQRLDFSYSLPAPDRLVLTGRGDGQEDVIVHLHRFEPEHYPLIGWKRTWRW